MIQPTIEVAPGITIPVGRPPLFPWRRHPDLSRRRQAARSFRTARSAPSARTAAVTDADTRRTIVSPRPLAADLRSADDRDCPAAQTLWAQRCRR
ncbi:hypothetical protein I553_8605 [Mycobacterium xenopi 4042]|uniref:Uncharacterized protein n=1 Tax=Mycobacterium xenopi 4042 TaxID=1299334 RepID=X8CJK1_MYCXE|nr:hypothetical protein I553_8605 [Mycobacterium xenopi 4042]